MHASRLLDRSAAAQSPSLRTFLAELPEEDILRISDPTELDYLPTALILELEKRRRTPVVMIERPKGFDCTVVTNLFASREPVRGAPGARRE
jgi:2,5-furandicarboxylate decarboxylase 1